MTPAERHAQITRLYLDLLDRPEAEHEDILGRTDTDNGGVRREVEAMLAARRRTPDFLDSPLIRLRTGDVSATPAESVWPIPARIGGYEVIDVLGEGGWSVVYRANQSNPRREVAIKLLKPGLASKDLARRIDYEARILARLQHPYIARVFESGLTDTGFGQLPYLAMELVRGEPLIDAARRRNLSIPQRIELFIAICEAVEHAHRKGIIHRDLKPANILVEHDETAGRAPRPKVLDFGIARATDADLKVTTLVGGAGQLVGSLHYMSPEQTASDADSLDIRSDIYALGVVGFELLTGQLPYRLDGKAALEVLRVIREDAPIRASTIDRRLAGDVDAILDKALRKEPTQRYQTVTELAEDLRRHLRDEPIRARGPSVATRLLKFARRHRQRLPAAAVGACLAITLCAVGITYMYVAPPWIENHVRSARLELLSPNFAEFAFMSIQMGELAFKEKTQWRDHIVRCAAACERAIQEYDQVLWAARVRKPDLAVRLERETVALARDLLAAWDAPDSADRPAVSADARKLLETHAPATMRFAEQLFVTDKLDRALEREFINVDATPLDLRCLGLLAYLCAYPRLCADAWSHSGFDLAEESDPLVDAALGQMYLESDEPSKAYTRLENAASEFPESKFLTIYLADAAVRCGDLEVAQHRLARAESISGPDYYDTSIRVRADWHAARGELTTARKLYEDHMAIHNSATTQLHYLRLLERLEGPLIAAEKAMEYSLLRPDVPGFRDRFVEYAGTWWASLDDQRRSDALANDDERRVIEQYWVATGAAEPPDDTQPTVDAGDLP